MNEPRDLVQHLRPGWDKRSTQPLGEQFVIEEHAPRHSWRHLARIRTALGR